MMHYILGSMGMLIGALIFWCGFITGKKHRPVTSSNVCSCNHSFGYHRNQKSCNQFVRVHGYTKTCPCQHYDGPLPAEEYLKNVLP